MSLEKCSVRLSNGTKPKLGKDVKHAYLDQIFLDFLVGKKSYLNGRLGTISEKIDGVILLYDHNKDLL